MRKKGTQLCPIYCRQKGRLNFFTFYYQHYISVVGGKCTARLIHGKKGLGVGLSCIETVQDVFLPQNRQTLGFWNPS